MESDAALAKEVRSTEKRVNVSLIVATVAAGFTGGTFLTQREALRTNQAIAAETQRTTLFLQFQQQYAIVRSGFPSGYADRNFRAAVGTDDYARLDAYWIFCFSEYYATQRINPRAFGNLWRDYYAPLIQNGLRNSALRHVLENRIRTSRGPVSKDWALFYREIRRLARLNNQPLDPAVERLIEAQSVA